MTEEEIAQTVIRYVRLRDELKPAPIWSSEPLAPIETDWVGINHAVQSNAQHSGSKEKFILFSTETLERLANFCNFDSLDLALAEAKGIAGIELIEWHNCNVSVPENGDVPWSLIVQQPAD